MPAGRVKPKRWSDLASVSELANMIDALPQHLRAPVLRAAMCFTPTYSFDESYLVGVYRSLVFDCVFDFCSVVLNGNTAARIQAAGLERRLSTFASADDPAQVQLALCDLLEFIADDLSANGRQ